MFIKNKVKLLSLALLITLVLAACLDAPDVANIIIKEETFNNEYNIYTFQLDDVELIVEYDNGNEDVVILNETMISESDLLKLNDIEEHEI